jgi:hypothetical protein
MKMIVSRELICGVCSGIPACCIKNSLIHGIRGTFDFNGSIGGNPIVFGLFTELYKGNPNNDFACGGISYLLCPECLKRKFVVKIRNCRDKEFKIIDPLCPFLKRGGPIPGWNNGYRAVLSPFFEPYQEGIPLEKGYCVVEADL